MPLWIVVCDLQRSKLDVGLVSNKWIQGEAKPALKLASLNTSDLHVLLSLLELQRLMAHQLIERLYQLSLELLDIIVELSIVTFDHLVYFDTLETCVVAPLGQVKSLTVPEFHLLDCFTTKTAC